MPLQIPATAPWPYCQTGTNTDFAPAAGDSRCRPDDSTLQAVVALALPALEAEGSLGSGVFAVRPPPPPDFGSSSLPSPRTILPVSARQAAPETSPSKLYGFQRRVVEPLYLLPRPAQPHA